MSGGRERAATLKLPNRPLTLALRAYDRAVAFIRSSAQPARI